MKQQSYEFLLTGVSPLLMHWDNLEGSDQLAEWRKVPENKKNSKAGDDRTPPFTWRYYVYNDGKHIVLPEDSLRACLMKAGAAVPTGKGKTTFKALTQIGLVFLEPFFEFRCNDKLVKWADIEAIEGTYAEHCQAARELGFQLFAKRAAVNQSKHVRVRPRFDKWSVRGSVVVTEEAITGQVLQTIFNHAGKYVALCDWRASAPKSPGPFGRFTATIKAV